MGGTEDRAADLKEILAWRAYTRGDFQYRMFEGGHFFIRERESEVLAEVRRIVGALGKNESFSVS
jgi:medium-chain acyl-[acyl-carrier-protein] hydrolase